MTSQPEPQSVDTEDEFIHVRYRDPDEFEAIRTPDWADNASDAVSEGSEVRMGKREGSDDWAVQSVLIKTSVGEEKAREQAEKIVGKLSE
jgi:1,2-phenylacetyl-CoA epoxidase PaaB subunit